MPISNLPAIRGELFPDDPGWDDARRAVNLTVDQRPAAAVSESAAVSSRA